MEFFDDVDFDLLKITFWALKMHQNTSLDIQIFKIQNSKFRGALVSRIQFNFLLLLFIKMKTL